MIKCTGREAISILAEVEANKRELTEDEEKYVRKQANNFVAWLMETADKSLDEAKEIAIGIYNSEVKLLLMDDPFAQFTWSRPGDEVGETEISGFNGTPDFELSSNLEFEDFSQYWEGRHLERHVGKFPTEQWKLSQERLDRILEVLRPYKENKDSELEPTPEELRELRGYNKLLNERRFGKKPVLLYPHWAKAKNLINELLSVEKRYMVKEYVERSEEEKIEELDKYGAPVVLESMDAVYGYFETSPLYTEQEELQE